MRYAPAASEAEESGMDIGQLFDQESPAEPGVLLSTPGGSGDGNDYFE